MTVKYCRVDFVITLRKVININASTDNKIKINIKKFVYSK